MRKVARRGNEKGGLVPYTRHTPLHPMQCLFNKKHYSGHNGALIYEDQKIANFKSLALSIYFC